MLDLPCEREVRLVRERMLEVRPQLPGIPDTWVREFLTDGKCVRARLLLLSYYAVGGRLVTKRVVDAACAIELIHAASLVHDDILDDAETRRGLLSAPVLFGEHLSLLLGDALFTEAFWLAASLGPEVAKMARDSVRDMVQGEAREVAHRAPDWTAEDAQLVAREKTAGVMGAACGIGGLLAQVPKEATDALHRFGILLGLAFQAVDDALDVAGEGAALGKPTGTDARIGAPNLARALGPDGARRAREQAAAWVREAGEALKVFPDSTEKARLEGLASFIVQRSM